MVKKNLCGLTADEIFSFIGHSDFTMSHAIAITNSIYKKRAVNASETAKIPKALREYLRNNAFNGLFSPVASEISEDKSVKYLFRTDSGKMFETVYIPDDRRVTVCVSTQSGCRMGCSCCVTARYGFHGNLTAGEIINQIISIPGAENVTHVVLMGMGEPMDNLDNVLKACEIMTSGWGLALSQRHITVSTVGIKPGIEKFLRSSGCNLTLSLFSPFPDERRAIIPTEGKYPVLDILEILRSYRVQKKRRLSIAYAMIKDVNDTDRHLNELIRILKDSELRVNLLPYHQVPDDHYISSSPERMMFFKHNLILSGISASIRKSRGIDISAACGMLAKNAMDINPVSLC